MTAAAYKTGLAEGREDALDDKHMAAYEQGRAAGCAQVKGVGTTDTPDGLFDPQLEYSLGEQDPLIDACPSWCVFTPHGVQSNDEDRAHFGAEYRVVLRDLTAEFDQPPNGQDGESSYTLGHVMMYLRRGTRNREPMIEANINDSGPGLRVTLDEAALIARALLEMVEAAR